MHRLLFFLILLGFTSCTSTEEVFIGMGSVKGKVTLESTGEPAAFVNVFLSKEGRSAHRVQSDAQGNYLINSVPAGIYSLEITTTDYSVESLRMEGIRVLGDRITFIDLKLKDLTY